MSTINMVRATVKARTPGKRGYDYYHQKRPGSYIEATVWIRRVWDRVEKDGGKVIEGFITPED